MLAFVMVIVMTSAMAQAQVMLADSAWSTTSNEQQVIAQFNGDLETQTQAVTIAYTKGGFDFTNASDASASFSVNTVYDKTELGVVYFDSEDSNIFRITIHQETRLVVVEYTDQSITSYEYGEIEIQN